MMERVYGERVLSESTLNGVVVSQVVQRGVGPKEEIVRCRDCLHLKGKDDMTCDHPRCVGHFIAEPNGFCVWGERKEGRAMCEGLKPCPNCGVKVMDE